MRLTLPVDTDPTLCSRPSSLSPAPGVAPTNALAATLANRPDDRTDDELTAAIRANLWKRDAEPVVVAAPARRNDDARLAVEALAVGGGDPNGNRGEAGATK